MAESQTRKVAVIAGAGPAGLTAAYELLARTDVVPLVLEATEALGGIAQTYRYKGNRIDIGGHRFFSKSQRVMDWWFHVLPLEKEAVRERAGDAAAERAPDPGSAEEVMLFRPRLSRIFYRRTFFPYPLGIDLAVARRLGFWNTFRIGVSYLKAQAFPVADETYLDAFFINRFGRRLYETFFRDYTAKVWGVPCEAIRADWGAQRVKGLSLKKALVQAAKDLVTSEAEKAREERETTLITRFYYPKYGPGQMWESVAERIRERGGEIRLGWKVVGLELEGGRVARVRARSEATGAEETLACDYFISTMPVRSLVGAVRPEPPAEVVEVAQGLVYRDFLTVGLLLRRLHVRVRGERVAERLPDNWIYIQEGDVKVGRVQVFNNWSPYMVRDPEGTVWIGLEYFLNEGDEMWRWTDEELVRLGIGEMVRIGFIREEDVLDGCALRMPKAYPAYFGTYERLDVVRRWAEAVPNLFLVGRNGMHRYNNQDHSMLTAMLAVDNIASGRTDKSNLWDVNLDMVYHEEHEGDPPADAALALRDEAPAAERQ
ncbi:MAG TPA: NAD(P)/FAD-dependent oxidoreductase [Longimicrobiales bacterium]|nr:NAD(P)/FAD-dependent oxidoreductase [Longimicrobiales bacterium]